MTIEKIHFQTTHNYLVLTFFYKSNNIINNNHLNKVDKHLNMLSYRPINLTITCNELLWSNSTSFCFLFILFSYKGNN